MKTNSKVLRTLKKGVLKNKKYTLKPIECPLKLNQNESPFDLPQSLRSKVLKKLAGQGWNIYPDFTPSEIYKKVARYYGLEEGNILIGNGSNEMIFTILASTLEKGKRFVVSEPTFTVYKLIASNLNADIRSIPLNDDFSFNTERILKEAKAAGSVTVLCSPNNPTGTALTFADIKKIVKASGGIVVVDEAYIQFGGETVLSLIKDYANLIVLRTLSKAFGLAGLRMGLMLSNKDLIIELSKVKLPYNLNIFTLAALDAVFETPKYMKENVAFILKERERVSKELAKFKELRVIPSSANFILVKPKDSKWLFDKLVGLGILVRDVSSYPMLKDHLRISIGDKKANDALIKALNKIFKMI